MPVCGCIHPAAPHVPVLSLGCLTSRGICCRKCELKELVADTVFNFTEWFNQHLVQPFLIILTLVICSSLHQSILLYHGHGCTTATNDRSFEQKGVVVFICSKAKWEWHLPSVLAYPSSFAFTLPDTDLVVEPKWQPLQVAREHRVREFVRFQMLQQVFKSDLWRHFGFCVSRHEKGEKSDRQDKKKTICRHCQQKKETNW